MLKTIEEHRQLGHLTIKCVERAVPIYWPWVDRTTWDRNYLLSICRQPEFKLVGGQADAEVLWQEISEIDGLGEVLLAAGSSLYTAINKFGFENWESLSERLADGITVHLDGDGVLDKNTIEAIPDYDKTVEVLKANPWLTALVILSQSDYFIAEAA